MGNESRGNREEMEIEQKLEYRREKEFQRCKNTVRILS